MTTPFTEQALDDFVKTLKKPLDCVVVGSGVSGLTTASLLVQSGVSVVVLERAAQHGGATHGFKESGFQFEMGLQEVGSEIWLGNSAKEPFAHVLASACQDGVAWKKLDGNLSYVVHMGEEEFPIRSSWADFRSDLVKKFPGEDKAIDNFHSLVQETRRCAVDWIYSRLPGSVNRKTSADKTARFRSLALRTVDEVMDAEVTKNAELRYLLTFLWAKMALPPRIASWGAFCLLVGQFLFDGVAYPLGGASSLEQAMIDVIEKSKLGKCFVDCRVAHVQCDNSSNACVGVLLEGGRVIEAEKVISAIGAVNTYDHLVPITQAELVRTPVKALKELKYASYSVLQVFFGFDGSSEELKLSTATHWFLPQDAADHTDSAVQYFLDSSFTQDFPYVHVSFPSAKNDPKSNKSTAVVFAAAHYDWFQGMKSSDVERCAQEIVSRLSNKLFTKFPHLKERMKFVELATPLAHEFQLGSNRGAQLGLGHSTSRFEQEWLRPQSPIKNLVLGGQDMLTASVVNASVGGFMAAATAFPEPVMKKFPNLL